MDDHKKKTPASSQGSIPHPFIDGPKDLYLAVFENFADAVILLDQHHEIVNLNASARRLNGCCYKLDGTVPGNCGRCVNRPVGKVFPWLATEISVLKPTPGSKVLKEISVPMNGDLKCFEVVYTGMQDVHNRFTGAIVTLKDVTEQKQAEQELRTSNRTWKAIMDAAYDSILVIDSEGHIVAANDVIAKRVNREAKELIGVNVYQLLPPDVAVRRKKTVEEAGRLKKSIHLEDSRGGLYIDQTVYPVFDDDGNVIQFAIFATDITERKHAELALLEYEAAIEGAKDMIAVMDRNYIYKIANKTFLDTRHKKREEVVGKSAPEVLGKDVFENKVKPLLDRAFNGEFIQFEMEYAYPDKGTRFLAVAYYPVMQEENGKFSRVVASINDITERKNAEKELLKAREAAEAASRSKSQFLSTMSHEIRTPMNAIIGMAEVLAETPLTAQQKQFVQVFQTAGEDLLTLVNDILDISKIEAGHFGLECIPFNLAEVVEKTCEILAVRAHKKKLELDTLIPSDTSIWLNGDPYRLRQILVNLIGNAIKFTQEGQVVVEVMRMPEVEIRDKCRLKDNCVEILFSVSDTGIGIPEHKLESIFDSFTQVDSSTTRQYGGTGLGLSISRRLVKMMNGEIKVLSVLNEGSQFTFNAIFELLPQSESIPAPPGIDLSGVKTMVVDDHENNRIILREMLNDWGADVHEAPSGIAALKELRRARDLCEPYRLVLLDRLMPRMDGFDVAGRIKKDPTLTDACVLMLTSDFGPGDISKSKELGIRQYLVKPVKRMELMHILKTVFFCSEIEEHTNGEIHHEPLPRFHSSRLLLVEDSPYNQTVVEAFLMKFPVEIDIAENGQQALEEFKKHNYGLVLMDIQMPVMDGLEATREIRKWEKENQLIPTPVIAMTAHALAGDEEKSLEAGCNAHLAKPMKKDTFLHMVGQYLPTVDSWDSDELVQNIHGDNTQTSLTTTKGTMENTFQFTTPPKNIPQQSHNPDYIDTKRLKKIFVKVDPVLKPYAPSYLDELKSQVAIIAQLVNEEKYDEIRGLGHRMKGDGGTYGFEDVEALGRNLQKAAELENKAQIRKLTSQLKEYLDRVEML